MRGPIPSPDIFAAYDEATQERILRMAEAGSTDESKRRDEMVTASTHAARRSQTHTLIMYFGAFAAAIGSYALFKNTLVSLAFLSVPVFKVIGATITSSVRKREPDEGD